MHIHFIGIGGAGIGPLAQIAFQSGNVVSGSDIQNSSYIEYLKKQGIVDITIGQSKDSLVVLHAQNPIDWIVYSSAISMQDHNSSMHNFAKENNIRISKRNDYINEFMEDNDLKMLAIAGTHGKTTTTAMLVWLFKSFNKPTSHILPAKVSYAEMGEYSKESKYLIYEADEFDRNFLAFHPDKSLISGVSYDHHEIFPTRDDYKQAFLEFIQQSDSVYIWRSDAEYLELQSSDKVIILEENEDLNQLTIVGKYNRMDAWLCVNLFIKLFDIDVNEVIKKINEFPGLSRRMEQIVQGLYSDYAHTPEKIRGALSVASELLGDSKRQLVVVYEPLTNRRQKYILDDYGDCFSQVDKLIWVDSYLAREDPGDEIIAPSELIKHLDNPNIAIAAKVDDELKNIINNYLQSGAMVVCIAGGGGGSLDDWLRANFK